LLTMVRKGDRPVGKKLLCGIAKVYPELHFDILAHLRNGHEDDA